MKTITLSILAVLIFSVTSHKHNCEKTINEEINNNLNLECPAPPAFVNTIRNENKKVIAETSSENIDQNWYSKAMGNIQNDEYKISYNKELGAYQSPNRKNNIRFIYHKDGFTAMTRDAKDEIKEEWSIDFRITNDKFQITNSEINAEENKASVENENLRIDYTNDENGMRQDFIIKQRPEGEGNLRLDLSAETKLKMIVGADALIFKNEKGIDKMKYSALKCWDANGKELRAYFENNYKLQITNYKLQRSNMSSDVSENTICNLKSEICNSFFIVVNDKDAVYPVTIDPLSTTPSWSAESDQAGSQFGFSVGTAGDINGDGYSDVIVGAPYFDNGFTDAGKTFVYNGSATGLSVTPSWTSEGDINTVNNGYSVSTAGDVNGDGYSDVIVGKRNTNSQWITQTSGTAQNLQDVYFTSPLNGCAVGADGVILTTSDGGTNWIPRTSLSPNDFRSNWFTTPDSGWAVGIGGTINVTTDGGASWATQTSGTSANLSCVYFRTSQEGYVSGGNGVIRKTTNAGLNWTAQTSGVSVDLRDIIFTSSATGWVVGSNGRILKTTNGGTNWVIQTSGTTQALRAVFFSSATTGMAFGIGGTFEKTTDGGTSWTTSNIGTSQDLYACSFTSALVGWTVGFGNTVLKTTDGGSSWVSKNSGISGDLRSVFFTTPDSACTVGSGGILYTYNASATNTNNLANVYFGSASGLSATPNNSLIANSGISSINNTVSTAGDINGDGYSDVIIGSSNTNSGTGAVLIYYGSATGSNLTPNTTLTGSQAASLYGVSVSTAGDADGDGYSDIIVGSSEYDNGQTNEGIAYVYRGSSSGLITTPYWTYESNQADSKFGSSVSGAGDVNGDGYSDVIIGSPNYFLSVGRTSLFLGSGSGISVTPDWTYDAVNFGDQLGSSVSTAGDVNGDGYADVIIGSPTYSNGETAEGRALVFNGSATGLPANPDWTNESNQVSANFGNSVFTAGDINGDGLSDVIVSAKLFDNGEADEGKIFVYNGSSAGVSTSSNWSTTEGQVGSDYGCSVSSAGDVNGDGYSDVIIGASRFDNGETDEGMVFAYYGSSSGLPLSPDWSTEINIPGANFGNSVSTAGDVNGDGYSDVIIGANKYTNPVVDAGVAIMFYGSATGLTVEALPPSIFQTGAGTGISVSTAGDVNGDGYSDVIVGANKWDAGQTDEGKAFVYFGSVTGISFITPNWTAEGNQTSANFGISVSTAGDVNGDGYSDVIVGSNLYNSGQADEGKAYVYFGSASGLSATANWTAESNQANANFGISVSSVGDVNGDGFSDVIVGCNKYDNGNTDEGRAYVYYGSVSGPSLTANWITESNQMLANFGSSVSTAGDVNGDGYSDVIVGAYTFSNAEFQEGNAFIYLGSSTGLPVTANYTLESNVISYYFGYSVASAGDVNGDGYSDVIVGSLTGTSGDGAAAVYYGNNGTSLRSTVQQFKPGSANVVASGGLTGTNGQVRLNTFGKSPFGRADGKIVYEYKDNGNPFSGSTISNSTSLSGSGSNTDLGISGSQLNNDLSGLNSSKEYKWRARVQYSLANNPFQKLGPWKYYNNYIPNPLGNFRPSDGITSKQLNLTMLIEGFYNAGSNTMVQDTLVVYLRNSISPYAFVDSSKAYLSSSGTGVFFFQNAANGVNYYLQLNHRNSIETWSKTLQSFTSNLLTYNFTTSNTQAFGDNEISIDASPVSYGVFSGDVNQDGTIDLSDGSLIDNDSFNFASGYLPTDVNGDEVTDLADAVFADNNGFNFVGKITP
ncbi:MAG: FG-GAP-like repeat-containing protein [Ignavibacteria bacterium]